MLHKSEFYFACYFKREKKFISLRWHTICIVWVCVCVFAFVTIKRNPFVCEKCGSVLSRSKTSIPYAVRPSHAISLTLTCPYIIMKEKKQTTWCLRTYVFFVFRNMYNSNPCLLWYIRFQLNSRYKISIEWVCITFVL